MARKPGTKAMCGIAGCIASQSRAELTSRVSRMTAALAHRGPDASGSFVDTAGDFGIALGHTRLAILDLREEGRQPMNDLDAGRTITFNGEVYNYAELRRELEDRHYRYNSETDTEVILKAFDAWGAAAWRRLRGMFALGVWDPAQRTLTLVRDPLGIKPLYVACGESRMAFASEIRALLSAGMVDARLSVAAVDSVLRTGAVESPLTMVEGVRSMEPGEVLTVRIGDGRLHYETGSCLGNLFDLGGNRQGSREDSVRELRAILEDSVRHHLISDVPLGVFLSGGIDSSALVGLGSRVGSGRLKTFSVIFDEQEFAETEHQRRVAQRFETDHQEIRLTGEGLIAELPSALAGMDQPTSDGINTYILSQAVKRAGVTVALTGLGGDELFAGYQSFYRAARLGQLAAIPRPIRRAAAAAGRALVNGSVARKKFWDLMAGQATASAVYQLSRQFFSPAEIQALTLRGVSHPASAADTTTDPVNEMSVLELRGYMSNTLLRDSDFMSMAHALELRVPFVDRVVVRKVLDMPGNWKLDGRRPKPLLLDALGDLLPESIWRRPKMGFTLPFRRWMPGPLKPRIEEAFDAHRLEAVGLQPGAVVKCWRRFLAAPQDERWARPWLLFGLSEWCARNKVNL